MYDIAPPLVGSDMHYGNDYNGKMSKDDEKAYNGSMDMKYRAEDDVRTLMTAKEIKGDKDRYAMALHCARMKSNEYKTIAGNSKA